MPIWLAHRLSERLTEVRKAGVLPYLRPDGKTQVTLEYENGKPVKLSHVLISTQHQDGIDRDTVIRPDLIEQVIRPIVPEQFADDGYDVHINPTGKFVIGGPHGDTGLTGRKIIVDTYGGMGRHGGGAFSGKDPSKVDRSAAYAARWVAKHVVASGAATRCEVQVAYAIGMAHPVSILVETFGTEKVDERQDRRRRARGVRPPSGRHRPRPRPEAPDLPADGCVRSLRPQHARLHLGARQPPRRVHARRRRVTVPGDPPSPVKGPPWWPGWSPTSPGSTRRSTTSSPTRCATAWPSGRWCACPLHGRRVGGWVVSLGAARPGGAGREAGADRQGVVGRPAGRGGRTGPLGGGALGCAAGPAVPGRRAAADDGDGAAAAAAHGAIDRRECRRRVGGVRRTHAAHRPAAASSLEVAAARSDASSCIPRRRRRAAIANRLRKQGLRVALLPDEWAQAAAGVDVVVGTRTAVWAPCPDLRSIVVLDEHDEALQEERTPTWHARDVAIERARRAGAACLLVSPCPTVTALHWAGDARARAHGVARR